MLCNRPVLAGLLSLNGAYAYPLTPEDGEQDTGDYGVLYMFRLRFHGKKKYKDPQSLSLRQFGCHTEKQSKRWTRAINLAAAGANSKIDSLREVLAHF